MTGVVDKITNLCALVQVSIPISIKPWIPTAYPSNAYFLLHNITDKACGTENFHVVHTYSRILKS